MGGFKKSANRIPTEGDTGLGPGARVLTLLEPLAGLQDAPAQRFLATLRHVGGRESRPRKAHSQKLPVPLGLAELE
jgi:hypothetical protein